MKKRINKKGVFDDVNTLLISLATIAIVLTVTFLILAQGKEVIINQGPCTLTNGSEQYNATLGDCVLLNSSGNLVQSNTGTNVAFNSTSTTQNAMQQVPDWLDIIVIVVIGGIILGIVALFRRQ